MATAKTNTAAPATGDEAADPAGGRVPGFKVGDVIYTFPAHIPVGWGLTYLRLYYGSSEDHALIWALSQLLGREQQVGLEDNPALDRDALIEVIGAARDALLGAAEAPKDS